MKIKFYLCLRWLALAIMVHHYKRFKKWHKREEKWETKTEYRRLR